jgi:hypothetical protein
MRYQPNKCIQLSFIVLTGIAILLTITSFKPAWAISIDPYYAGSYSFTDLGSVPGVPSRYGGLTLKAGDSNTLIMGGEANVAAGALYSIGLTRDAGNHITGFTGTASYFADAAYNDGGVVYGPDDVLFLARWPVNQVGETKLGSVITDKIIDLGPLGIAPSPGGLAFVPSGFPGANQLKLVSWSGGQWYTLDYAPDGAGTYDMISATLETTISGGPEGIAYVPIGSPLFPNPSLLVSEYSAGTVGTYEIDANGNPILSSRRDFMTGLTGAEGSFIDPLTGDFLFSTFGGGDRVVVVQGFALPPIPPSSVPEPGTMLLLSSGIVGMVPFIRRKFKK